MPQIRQKWKKVHFCNSVNWTFKDWCSIWFTQTHMLSCVILIFYKLCFYEDSRLMKVKKPECSLRNISQSCRIWKRCLLFFQAGSIKRCVSVGAHSASRWNRSRWKCWAGLEETEMKRGGGRNHLISPMLLITPGANRTSLLTQTHTHTHLT